MKRILTFGDSNTWGFIPGTYNIQNYSAKRYPRDVRWSMVMGDKLGQSYEVIEEGLSSRTTILDDPFSPIMTSGKSYLLPCLLSHFPLDMVIIMLGTNDIKPRFNLSAADVARGMRQLITLIRSLGVGIDGASPEILIICPPNVIEGIGDFKDQFIGTAVKSKEMVNHYYDVCQLEKCHFLDANLHAKSSMIDGIHLDKEDQISLGLAVADKVNHIFTSK